LQHKHKITSSFQSLAGIQRYLDSGRVLESNPITMEWYHTASATRPTDKKAGQASTEYQYPAGKRYGQ
jgi:hypothetical protein